MQENLTIALVQHVSTPGDIDASLARIASYAQQAKAAGAQLLLFPEASLTGYNNSKAVTQAIAQAADGPVTQAIATICQSNRLAIAYGFAENDNGQIYNSVQWLDANGDTQSLYRKSHLWGEQDRQLFTAGDRFAPVIEWQGWRIGLLICYDIEFPESVRHLALTGADLILAPTALMSPWTTVADLVVPVRAYENQLFIAYANFCGHEYDQHYVGHSCIVGPEGNTLAQAADEEVMLIATVDRRSIDNIRAKLPYHADRRPELYRALTHDE